MAAGDDTSEVVVLAGFTPDEAGFTSETVTLASFTPTDAGIASEVVTLVSYIWVQPPPWPQVGHQSPSDAYNDLPGSEDPGPYQSNWDALRGLKQVPEGVTFGNYTAVPGSPDTGDRHYCDDCPYVRIYDGTGWRDWLDGFGFVEAPANTTFTKNAGLGGSIITQGGAIRGNTRAHDASAPADWTCDVIYSWLHGDGGIGQFSATEAAFYDTGTTGEVMFYVAGYTFGGTAGGRINVQYNSNPTTYLSSPMNEDGHGVFSRSPWVFMRMTYDSSTNRTTFLYSPDGYNFRTLFTDAGFLSGSDVKPAVNPSGGLVLHWKVY
jgi:hypothetical protein